VGECSQGVLGHHQVWKGQQEHCPTCTKEAPFQCSTCPHCHDCQPPPLATNTTGWWLRQCNQCPQKTSGESTGQQS
jgi:hypothetical protein